MEEMKNSDKTTIGRASVYNTTYYYNPFFAKLPDAVKEEVQQICTFYSAKLHCVFSMEYKESESVKAEKAA